MRRWIRTSNFEVKYNTYWYFVYKSISSRHYFIDEKLNMHVPFDCANYTQLYPNRCRLISAILLHSNNVLTIYNKSFQASHWNPIFKGQFTVNFRLKRDHHSLCSYSYVHPRCVTLRQSFVMQIGCSVVLTPLKGTK